MNKTFIKGFLAGLACTVIVGAGVNQASKIVGGMADANITDGATIDKLEYVEDLINDYYLHDIEKEDLKDGMFAGLLAGLDDPYSRYYSTEEYEELTEETEGHYKGIGVVMQQNTEGIVHVVRAYEGSPGEKAGILPGDIIYMVGDELTSQMELSQVADKIRDPEEDPIHLTVVREGEEDYLEFDIEKEEVEVPVVEHEMLDSEVGYLSIYEFTDVTFPQYEAAYEDLKNQGMKRLIVDLRNNPGGLLDSVCNILNTFLPEGTIVYTEDKNGNRTDKTSEGKTPIDIPLVVLVNENSASASEIFAGAVQDYQVGTIVGTTTYGKGVVQTIKRLSDGSAVKLTQSNYYTPNGNNIDGKGITPDVEAELSDELKKQSTLSHEEDTQLQKGLEVIRKK